MSEQKEVWDLPFDVLCLIFDELFFLRDELRFASIHSKLGEVFVYKKRHDLVRLNLDRLTLQDALLMVKVAGSSAINSIYCTRNLIEVLEYAKKYCQNLEILHIHINAQDDISMIAKCVSQITTLQILEMRSDINVMKMDTDPSNGTLVDSLKELPNLIDLKLVNFPDIEVIHIKKLNQLENLYLSNIQFTTLSMQRCLQEAFSIPNKLKSLKLFDGHLIRADFIEMALIEASRLPPNPYLDLRRLGPAMGQLTELKQLFIHDVYINNESLLQVMRGCRVLTCLKLYGTYQINHEFVVELLTILDLNQFVNAQNPFFLHTENTGITEDIFMELSDNENIHLINISVRHDRNCRSI